MSSGRRPMAILLVSCLYIAVGAIGLLVNIPQSMRSPTRTS